jgi:K+-transporting ATPase ATPase C chain
MKLIRPALSLFLLLTIATGIVYPLIVTAIGQLAFPKQANGSLIESGGKAIGSRLIGQPFTENKYFWSRPSATSPMPYNATSSSGSNLGPTNPALVDAIKPRIAALKEADPGNTAAIPVDLVTSSASGLDPHISAAAAYYQLERVARVRQLPVAKVRALIESRLESPLLGFIGSPQVNVLELNLALDALT